MFNLNKTAREAREYVQQNRDEGVRCPCCDRFAKIYSRGINSTMASGLIWLVQAWESGTRLHSVEDVWGDVANTAPRWLVRSNQLPSLRWWGLLVRPDVKSGSTTKHSGLWGPTEKGMRFAKGRCQVASHVLTYNGQPVGFEGDLVHITECLEENFNYKEIMGEKTDTTSTTSEGTMQAPVPSMGGSQIRLW